MSKTGGYAIVDLEDVALVGGSTSKVTIAGTYQAAQRAIKNRRAVLLSGINIAPSGGAATAAVAYPDAFGSAHAESSTQITIRASAAGQVLLVHVTEDDGVIAVLG